MSWRDTLFCWRGALNDGQWSGAWTSSDTLEVPQPDAFEDSLQTFTANREGADSGSVSGQWRSSYKLNVSTTKRARFVTKNEGPYALLALATSTANARVLGCGVNEFGAFVIDGVIDSGVMTLCRRYVDDDDVRASMSPADLEPWSRERVLASAVEVRELVDGDAGSDAKKAKKEGH